MRREQQARRAERLAQVDAERALSGSAGSYTPPPREQCRSKTWFQSLDDADTVRIYFRTWRKGAVLADFALSVEVADVDTWTIAARVDCKGGTCHLHPPEDLDRHDFITALSDVGDMRGAFELAYERLIDIGHKIRDMGRDDNE